MPIFATQNTSSTPRRSKLRRIAAAGIAAMTALTLSSCGLTQAGSASSDEKAVSSVVTETPRYQERTEIAGELLAEEGWESETTSVTDITQPRDAVSQGAYDANFFRHAADLRHFDQDDGT